MTNVKFIQQHYVWAYNNTFGREIHGNGMCNSKLEAVEKLCKEAGTPITDELRKRFGVDVSEADESIQAQFDQMRADIEMLKNNGVQTLNMIESTNEKIVANLKPVEDVVKPVAKKRGPPKGFRKGIPKSQVKAGK